MLRDAQRLPPEHVALREARAREDAGDATARAALHARLGRPQGWVARNAAALSLAGFLQVAVSMVGWPLVAAYGVPLGRFLGVHPIDVLGGGVRSAMLAGGEVAVVILVSVLLFKLSDVTEALGDQQALVAADPPREAGGARRCRSCAAPLDVPPGAIGVRCAYCRAENLVSLPAAKRPPARRRIRGFPLFAQPTMAEAQAAVDAARPALLPALVRAAVAAIVLGGFPVGCACVTSHQLGESWWSEVRGPRRAYRRSGEPEVWAQGQASSAPYCGLIRRRGGWSAPNMGCGVQVALRRGEALVVALSRVSPKVSVSGYELDEDLSEEMPATWSEGARHDDGTVDGVATFVAPYSGWFSIIVLDARAGMPKALFDMAQMRWSIGQAGGR